MKLTRQTAEQDATLGKTAKLTIAPNGRPHILDRRAARAERRARRFV